jgi:hypothetical protein
MLKNSDMIKGRFAKLAKGRKLMARMNACWNAGGFVRIGTYTRYTDYKTKHREMVKMGKSGDIYTQRGKHWDCASFSSFQFTA